MIFVGLILTIMAADLYFKAKIENQQAGSFPRPLPHTAEKIRLYRSHNAGFPFGFLARYKELVCAVPLAITSALAGILYCLLQQPGRTVQKLGVSLLIGGSLSNLYDRWARGYVVDYFSIRLGWLKKVVLNLGDVFVFAGAVLLLLREFARDLGTGGRLR